MFLFGVRINTNMNSLVEMFPDKPLYWGLGGLSSNPSITIEFILQFIDRDRYRWHWGKWGLSSNPAVTPDFIDRFPASDRRAVEHKALFEEIFVNLIGHDCDVLQLAARVGEPDVDVFRVFVLDQL